MSQGMQAATRLPRPEQIVAIPPGQTALMSARLEMEMLGVSACLNTDLREVAYLSESRPGSRHCS